MLYAIDTTKAGTFYDRMMIHGATSHDFVMSVEALNAGAEKVRWKTIKGMNNNRVLTVQLGKLGVHKFAKKLGENLPVPTSYLELVPLRKSHCGE